MKKRRTKEQRKAARRRGRAKAAGIIEYKGDKELLRFAGEQAAKWANRVAAKNEGER